ncbi:MAG: hypothetical protein V4687_02735 [Bacteroidota bacterium]
MKFLTISFAVVIAVLCFSSCGNTKLISSYAAPQAKIQKNNKILVIAMMGEKDKKLRENVESVLVQTLRAQGLDAGSSLKEFGPDAFAKLDEKTTMQKLKDQGFDGTFTIALINKSKDKAYRPGYVALAPSPYRFWGYYNSMYVRVYRPGYYADNNQFVLEGIFYSIGSDKLLYSAQTRTVNPNSPHALASVFTKTLLDDMNKNGVFSN